MMKILAYFGLLWPFAMALIAFALFGEETYITGTGMLLGSILLFLYSYRRNRKPPVLKVDNETGQEFLVKDKYHLYDINVEWFAVVFIIMSIGMILSDITDYDITEYGSGIAILLVIILFARKYYFKYFKKEKNQQIKKVNRVTQKELKQQKRSSSLDTKDKNNNKIDMSKLSEEEQRKKAYYASIKNKSSEVKDYKTSNHSDYLPK